MKNKSNRNEGIQIIADFTEEAIPPGGAPPELSGIGAASRAVNEGIHPLADFTDLVQPLHESTSDANNAKKPFDGKEISRQGVIMGEGYARQRSVFLFPGQGAQSVGMAKELCATLPEARQ